MTMNESKRLMLGVLTTVLAGIALPTLLGAWNGKVDRGEFELHVQREEAALEAVLDLLCTDHPTHRRCTR